MVERALWVVLVCASGCASDTSWVQVLAEEDDPGWIMNVTSVEGATYFVGGSPDEGVVLRREGGAAVRLELPDGVPLVNWAHGFASDDVHLVGNGGRAMRWDGGSVISVPTPTSEDLWGVWGAAPDDVWAVGGEGVQGATAVLLHYDGQEWTDVPLPEIDREARGLFKVWGSSATDVYAVGASGLVLHYDGAAWTQIVVGAPDDLVAVWGLGPDHVAIVGGRSNGTLSFYDGSEWRTEFVDEARLPGLNGVWMREPGVIHVAGFRGTVGVVRVSDDGFSYTPGVGTDDEQRTFHSIHGAAGRLTVVGGTIGRVDLPFQGMAYERGLGGDE